MSLSAQVDNSLSLEECINYSIKHNPELKAARAEIRKEKAVKSAIYFPDDPTVSYMKEGFKDIGSSAFAEQKYSVSQDIENPFTTGAKASVIKRRIEALKFAYLQKRTENITQIKKIYANVTLDKYELSLRRRVLGIADTVLNAVKIRLEAGYSNELELMQSEITLQEKTNDLRANELRLHQSRYTLFTNIGLDPELQQYSIDFPDTLHFTDPEVVQDTVLSKLESYAEIISAQELIKSYDKAISAEYLKMLPNFKISAYQQDYGTGYDFTGIEFGISVPLWFWGNQVNRIEAATTDMEIAESQHRRLLLNHKLAIEYAWHGYHESAMKIKNFQETILDKSLKLSQYAFQAYLQGSIGLIEYLNYEDTYLKNQLAYIEQLRIYYGNIIELEKYLNENYLYDYEVQDEN